VARIASLLAVGIERSAERRSPICPGAEADVRAVADAWRQETDVTLLVGADATTSAIADAVAQACERGARRSDHLIIWLAGPARWNARNGVMWLATYDDGAGSPSHALSIPALLDLAVRRSHRRHVTIVLDLALTAASRGDPNKRALRVLDEVSDRATVPDRCAIIAACAPSTRARFDARSGYGHLTRHMLAAKDASVTAAALPTWLADRVPYAVACLGDLTGSPLVSERSPAIDRRVTASRPAIIDTASLSVVSDPLQGSHFSDRAQRTLSRRELLLRWGGAAIAATTGVALLSQTKPVRQVASAIFHNSGPSPAQASTMHLPTSSLPFGYFHACFEINTPDEVAKAAALGINYTITYGNASWASADPTSAMGKALARYGMKTFLNLEYPYLTCIDGYGHLDSAPVSALVAQFKDSPLIAGYWIKDDDCGDESVAVIGLYQLIRSIDTNVQHWIVPGFGDAGSVAKNYAYGEADLLGFYPYPAYSRGPAGEVPDMLREVRQRTPAGKQPPPFIGIYQAFATPPWRPAPSSGDIVAQAQTYLHLGAAGVAAFGWEAPNESLVIGNDPTFAQGVGAVTHWMAQHGYGSRPSS
jgi:hypothetical protein